MVLIYTIFVCHISSIRVDSRKRRRVDFEEGDRCTSWGLKKICTCFFFFYFFVTKNSLWEFVFTFILWLLNSFDLLNYGSNPRKRYTLRLLLMCQVEGRVLEAALPYRGQITYMNKSLPRGTGSRRKLCKLTIKCNSSKTFFKDFANTLRTLPNDCLSKPIYRVTQKMHIAEYECKSCLKE